MNTDACRTVKPSQYTFVDYSPEWPREFEQEAHRLRTLLEAELTAVHHIGSTSVPGLPAKPIIDVLPVVRDIERKAGKYGDPLSQQILDQQLQLAHRLLAQTRTSKNKLYSIHAPEVECIGFATEETLRRASTVAPSRW